VRKLECESSAKILREREIGAAKIWARKIEFKRESVVQMKRVN
jgi:hypothetical protein